MYTAIYSASTALSNYLRTQLEALPAPGLGFGGGGPRVVVLNSPHELREEVKKEGLSVWLYRIERDEMRLNVPDERLPGNLLRPPPLPLRVHFLMTPVTFTGASGAAPDVEQKILGRVMQALHTRAILQGTDLDNTDLEGSDAQFHVHLEALALDELSRVWEALEGSFTLAVSYEVTVVNVDAALEPRRMSPVKIALPEVSVIVEEA
jgi:hypothetical protein